MTSVRPCRPGLRCYSSPGYHQGYSAEDQDHDRDCQDVRDDELHLRRADLLAEEFRGPADHEAGDEHRQQREDEDAVQPAAIAAGADLAEQDRGERRRSADRRVAVQRRVGRASGGAHGPDGHQRGPDGPKRPPCPPCCRRCWCRSRPATPRRQQVVAVQFGLHGDHSVGQEDRGHHRDERQRLLPAADQPPEHHDDRERQDDDQQQLEDVGEAGRVLERVRAARPVHAAAVGAQ